MGEESPSRVSRTATYLRDCLAPGDGGLATRTMDRSRRRGGEGFANGRGRPVVGEVGGGSVFVTTGQPPPSALYRCRTRHPFGHRVAPLSHRRGTRQSLKTKNGDSGEPPSYTGGSYCAAYQLFFLRERREAKPTMLMPSSTNGAAAGTGTTEAVADAPDTMYPGSPET